MWFNPRDITLTANSAKTANFEEEEIKEISEISEISNWGVPERFVKCEDCLDFKSNNAHGRGSGYCLSGGAYGSWSESLHQCEKYNAKIEYIEICAHKPDALIVTCYTPDGELIKIEAKDEVHAIWLKQMNPKPTGKNK